MQDVTLFIRFSDNQIKVTNEILLSPLDYALANDLNSFKTDVYWRVKPLSIWKGEKRLAVEIIGYGFGSEPSIPIQSNFLKELSDIEFINFKNIPTEVLMGSISGPKKLSGATAYYPIITSGQSKIGSEIKKVYAVNNHFSQQEQEQREERYQEILDNANEIRRQKEEDRLREHLNRTIKINHVCRTSDLYFFDGGVGFKMQLEDLKSRVDLKLYNKNIKKEYSAILPYFNKSIGTNKLLVKGAVKLKDGNIDVVDIDCEELKKVERDFTNQVKVWILSEIEKEQYSDVTLTSDIIINRKTNGNRIKNLFDGDKVFFESLINERNTKHFKHLSYLSEQHLFDLMKIRYVFKPFGFLFLMQNQSNYFIVWESLDEEDATWVWTVENDISKVRIRLDEVEKIISVVQEDGRNCYINKDEPLFFRVFHDYNDGGFERWKYELEEKMLD